MWKDAKQLLCRRAAALAESALALHSGVPAVRSSAFGVQAEVQKAWASSGWLADDDDADFMAMDVDTAAPPANPAAAQPSPAAVLQWAAWDPTQVCGRLQHAASASPSHEHPSIDRLVGGLPT